MNLGKNIKELRARAHLTQKDLAEKLNVTPQAVSRWELDTVEPSIDTLKDMAILFGVTMDELMSDNLDLENNNQEEVVEPIIVSTDETDNESDSKEEPLPVVGKCKYCGKLIHAGEGKQIVLRGGTTYFECDDCIKRLEKEAADDKLNKVKKMRIKAWIVSSLIGVAVLAGIIASGIAVSGQPYIGATIGAGIGLGILSFTTVFCIMMHNNFVGDLWLEVATWGCVKLPGVIFTLSFNGIVFLIIVKILCFILSGILIICALFLATALAFVCSIFVFPVSVYWAYKRPDKTDLF